MAKDKMKKEVAPKTKRMKGDKAGNTKKAEKTKKLTHEGVSASVATYVNFQLLSQFNRGLCVASSSWPNRK